MEVETTRSGVVFIKLFKYPEDILSLKMLDILYAWRNRKNFSFSNKLQKVKYLRISSQIDCFMEMRPGQKIHNLIMFPVRGVIERHLSELKGYPNLRLSALWHTQDMVNLEYLMSCDQSSFIVGMFWFISFFFLTCKLVSRGMDFWKQSPNLWW